MRPLSWRSGALGTGLLLLMAAFGLGCGDVPESGDSGGEAPAPGVGWLADGALDEAAMVAWMQAGGYRAWVRSPSVFPSTAGGGTRVFLNPVLEQSLAAGDRTHPAGAISVREITHDDLQTLRGVNLMVKLEDGGGVDPGDWLFVEVFDLRPGGRPSLVERGADRCLVCHDRATDFVRSPWPLE